MADEITIQRGTWERLRDYYQEIKLEMKRVTWPTKQEVYATTVLVLACTFAFALFFWICDETFSHAVVKMLHFLSYG
ncbi:MAG: preprotein translocase subunit SecE, partial [Terriglobia bacterium]